MSLLEFINYWKRGKKLKDKLKGLVFGILIGSLVTGATAFAGTNSKIDVVMENVKYMFDGVHKSTTQSIVYKGNLYIPAKTVAQGMGETFTYDGKNKTAWIGKKEGSFKYLDEVAYARIDGDERNISLKNWNDSSNSKFQISDQKYLHGLGQYNQGYMSNHNNSIDYNLNGGYKRLTGYIGIDDSTKNSESEGTIIVKGDGVDLFRKDGMKGGDMPESINVDITGVLKLQIVFESDRKNNTSLDIVLGDAKLYK